MLLRLRWFFLGALSSAGLMTAVLVKLRRMRERFTARAVARASALTLADSLELAGRAIAPPPHTVTRRPEAIAPPPETVGRGG